MQTPGSRFRVAVTEEQPLQVVGVINAYCTRLAEQAGYRALYLSGAGVANASYGLPDLGITTLADVVEDAQRITAITDLPLLVDIDTGWGGELNIARAIKTLTRVGVAAVHIEDQAFNKRCGHRPDKKIISQKAMVDRIKAAVDARSDDTFVIMARSDALAAEGESAMLDRLHAYIEAGADMLFPEAVTELAQYQRLKQQVDCPILANITEFGRTPLFTVEQLKSAGVDIALYPLSAFRAMSQAAQKVYHTIREQGSQQSLLSSMQTRESLYACLDYHAMEQQLNQRFSEGDDYE